MGKAIRVRAAIGYAFLGFRDWCRGPIILLRIRRRCVEESVLFVWVGLWVCGIVVYGGGDFLLSCCYGSSGSCAKFCIGGLGIEGYLVVRGRPAFLPCSVLDLVCCRADFVNFVARKLGIVILVCAVLIASCGATNGLPRCH